MGETRKITENKIGAARKGGAVQELWQWVITY